MCSIYLAPSTPVEKRDLAEILKQLPPPILLLGDFNIRHPLWGDHITSPNSNILVDLLNPFSLGCLNSGIPTYERLDTHSSSCIDVSLCSLNILDRYSWNRSDFLHGSDHYPIILSANEPIQSPKPHPSWRYDRANWNSFYHDTALNPFFPEFYLQTIDEAFLHFRSQILSAAESNIPKSSSPRRPTNPWWSQDCAQAHREKRKLYKKYLQDRNQKNLLIYKVAAARSRRINRQSRRQYFRNYTSTITSSTPTSLVFQKVKKISGRPHNTPIVLRYGQSMEDTISEPAIVADALGFAFSSYSNSKTYSLDFNKIRNTLQSNTLDFSTNTDQPYNHLFTRYEFDDSLKSCDSGAPSPYDISYEMVKHLHPTATAYLLKLFNRIWVESTIPKLWSSAFIVPIPKPGKDPRLENNYRPISLTCNTCKIMERMVAKRLHTVLEDLQALPPFQFGFRKFKSTTEPLLLIDSYIRASFSRKEKVLGVFFDLEKAYDTTWRKGIISKLHALGLRGQLPLFLSTLLAERVIQVKCSNTLSRQFLLEEGVPPGQRS